MGEGAVGNAVAIAIPSKDAQGAIALLSVATKFFGGAAFSHARVAEQENRGKLIAFPGAFKNNRDLFL